MDTFLTISLITVGLILVLGGLIGCIFPIIPGPPLSYIALLILSFAKNWEPFSTRFLIVMGIATVIILLLDYLVPVAGAKKSGASKWGIWGSILGMIIGVFVFPPFGLFIGGFVGALAGELYSGKSGDAALKAGIGVFIGNLISIGLKFGFCGVILFFYLTNIF